MSTKKQVMIDAAELSALTEMSLRTLRRHAELGRIPRPKGGKYPFAATMRGLLQHMARRVAANSDTLAGERLRLLTVRRERLEAARDRLRAQYVKAAEVGPLLRRLAYHQREALTRILCDELPPKLVGLDPIAARRVMAEHGTDRVCDTFTANIRLWLDVPTPDEAR